MKEHITEGLNTIFEYSVLLLIGWIVIKIMIGLIVVIKAAAQLLFAMMSSL